MKYLLVIILFISCKKHQDSSVYVTFYKSTLTTRQMLFVNRKYMGILTPISSVPVCGDNVSNKVITVYIPEGDNIYYLTDDSTEKAVRKINVSGHCQTIEAK